MNCFAPEKCHLPPTFEVREGGLPGSGGTATRHRQPRAPGPRDAPAPSGLGDGRPGRGHLGGRGLLGRRGRVTTCVRRGQRGPRGRPGEVPAGRLAILEQQLGLSHESACGKKEQKSVGKAGKRVESTFRSRTVLVGAGEVCLSLDGAVVLALGLLQDDADPFSGRELGKTDEGHLTLEALVFHRDLLADLQRLVRHHFCCLTTTWLLN